MMIHKLIVYPSTAMIYMKIKGDYWHPMKEELELDEENYTYEKEGRIILTIIHATEGQVDRGMSYWKKMEE